MKYTKKFKIPGYDSEVQSKINDKQKGSGLAIYLDENLVKNKIKECCISTYDIESLFITIENTPKPVTFGVVYRPPNGNLKNFFSQFEKIISSLPDNNSIITGDFNINFHLPSNDSMLCDFENIIYGNCFVPLISLATHHKPNCNPSCIDNIIVNSYDNLLISGTLEWNVSHHTPIMRVYDSLLSKSPVINPLHCQNMTIVSLISLISMKH